MKLWVRGLSRVWCLGLDPVRVPFPDLCDAGALSALTLDLPGGRAVSSPG